MSTRDYFIRCKEQDVPALMALAELLGILRKVGADYVPVNPNWVWVPIGRIWKDIDTASPVVSKASDGSAYWHANLRLTVDLMEHAQAVYQANPSPALAQGLADIGRFFFVDANGRAARPADPAMTFA